MSLEKFLQKYGNVTEEYKFYNGEHTLRYDPVKHIYYLVTPAGLEPLEGVSTVAHIIDKSDILVPWGCKMMGQKLTQLSATYYATDDYPHYVIPANKYMDIIKEAKSAHKDKLEDAGEVGKTAHAWIESYIKQQLGTYTKGDLEERLGLMDERSHSCCNAALDWMKKHNVRWRNTERKVYSHLWGYAGTMDGLCLTDSCSDPKCCPIPFKDKLTLADWKTSNYLYIEFVIQVAAYKEAYEEETKEHVEDVWVIRLGKEDAEFEPWHLNAPMITFGTIAFQYALQLSRAVDSLEKEIAFVKDQVKAKEREAAHEARQEALKLRCAGADRYKGIRQPRCNGGNPCKACLLKYSEVQAKKAIDK